MESSKLKFTEIKQHTDTVEEMSELLKLTRPEKRRALYARAAAAWHRERAGELLKSIYADIASLAGVSADTVRRALGKK